MPSAESSLADQQYSFFENDPFSSPSKRFTLSFFLRPESIVSYYTSAERLHSDTSPDGICFFLVSGAPFISAPADAGTDFFFQVAAVYLPFPLRVLRHPFLPIRKVMIGFFPSRDADMMASQLECLFANFPKSSIWGSPPLLSKFPLSTTSLVLL